MASAGDTQYPVDFSPLANVEPGDIVKIDLRTDFDPGLTAESLRRLFQLVDQLVTVNPAVRQQILNVTATGEWNHPGQPLELVATSEFHDHWLLLQAALQHTACSLEIIARPRFSSLAELKPGDVFQIHFTADSVDAVKGLQRLLDWGLVTTPSRILLNNVAVIGSWGGRDRFVELTATSEFPGNWDDLKRALEGSIDQLDIKYRSS